MLKLILRNGRKEGQDDTGTEREEEAPLACIIKQPDPLGNQSSVLVASWESTGLPTQYIHLRGV